MNHHVTVYDRYAALTRSSDGRAYRVQEKEAEFVFMIQESPPMAYLQMAFAIEKGIKTRIQLIGIEDLFDISGLEEMAIEAYQDERNKGLDEQTQKRMGILGEDSVRLSGLS